jgi:hypothetical protein
MSIYKSMNCVLYCMYVGFMRQGRCFAIANVVVVVVVIILSSRSEHWLNNFRLLMNDDDYPFFFLLLSDDKPIMIELCSSLSFFSLAVLHSLSSSHNYSGMFIHSLGLPPTRLCRNIKTSSSLSSSFSKNLRESTDNHKVSLIFVSKQYVSGRWSNCWSITFSAHIYIFRWTTYKYSLNE